MYHRRRGNGAALNLRQIAMACYHKRHDDYIFQRILFSVIGVGIVVTDHPLLSTFYIAGWSSYYYVKWQLWHNNKTEEKEIARQDAVDQEERKARLRRRIASKRALIEMEFKARGVMMDERHRMRQEEINRQIEKYCK